MITLFRTFKFAFEAVEVNLIIFINPSPSMG